MAGRIIQGFFPTTMPPVGDYFMVSTKLLFSPFMSGHKTYSDQSNVGKEVKHDPLKQI